MSQKQPTAWMRAYQVDMFKGLSTEQLSELQNRMVQHWGENPPYVAGEYIIEQGDVGEAFFVILEGEAEVMSSYCHRRRDASHFFFHTPPPLPSSYT